MTVPVLLHGRSVLLPIDAQTARASGLDGLLAELANGQPVRSGPVAHALPTRDLDELEHVAAALDDARRYLDGSVVGYFGSQLDRCKADDGSLGPARALPRVLGVLGAISSTCARSSLMCATPCSHSVRMRPATRCCSGKRPAIRKRANPRRRPRCSRT